MKPILRGSALVLSLAACFGFGYYYKDVSRGSAPGGRAINTLLGVQTTSPSLSAEAAFRENYARILNNFPRKLDAKELKYSGMEGLVGALGDPHTNFFPPRRRRCSGRRPRRTSSASEPRSRRTPSVSESRRSSRTDPHTAPEFAWATS